MGKLTQLFIIVFFMSYLSVGHLRIIAYKAGVSNLLNAPNPEDIGEGHLLKLKQILKIPLNMVMLMIMTYCGLLLYGK